MAFVMASDVISGDEKTIVLLCLNCGTWYTQIENNRVNRVNGINLSNPEHPFVKEPIAETASGEIILTDLGCCVSFPPARWATAAEIIDFGWGEYRVEGASHWLPEHSDWWPRRIRGCF
jgi:hypothetical protein